MAKNNFHSVCEICKALIEERFYFVEGCREIVSFVRNNDLTENEDFYGFVGFCSEVDDYPEKEIRERFSKEFLDKVDNEVNLYISKVKPAILEDCKLICSNYG